MALDLTRRMSYFRPTNYKTLRSSTTLFWQTVQIATKFLHIPFWLNPMRHSKFHNTLNTLRLLPTSVGLLGLPCTCQHRRFPSPLFFPQSRRRSVPLPVTEEPAKVGTFTRDRRALQQLALNVHVKHSYLYRYLYRRHGVA